MEISEESVRTAPSTRHSATVAGVVLAALKQGDLVIIHRENGSTLTLTDVHMAKRLMPELFERHAA